MLHGAQICTTQGGCSAGAGLPFGGTSWLSWAYCIRALCDVQHGKLAQGEGNEFDQFKPRQARLERDALAYRCAAPRRLPAALHLGLVQTPMPLAVLDESCCRLPASTQALPGAWRAALALACSCLHLTSLSRSRHSWARASIKCRAASATLPPSDLVLSLEPLDVDPGRATAARLLISDDRPCPIFSLTASANHGGDAVTGLIVSSVARH